MKKPRNKTRAESLLGDLDIDPANKQRLLDLAREIEESLPEQFVKQPKLLGETEKGQAEPSKDACLCGVILHQKVQHAARNRL